MARLIYGHHAVAHALQQQNLQGDCLWVQQGSKEAAAMAQQAQERGLAVSYLPRQELTRKVGHSRHQGLALQVPDFCYTPWEKWLQDIAAAAGPRLAVTLDGVTDPQNVGALCRSAEAAGALGLLLPKNRAASITPGAEKVASGALQELPVMEVVNLRRCLDELKKQGFWVWGLAGEASWSLYEAAASPPTDLVLVLGSEEKGLRQGVRDACDALVHIPMYGKVASLNVAAAGAVAMFASRRGWEQ